MDKIVHAELTKHKLEILVNVTLILSKVTLNVFVRNLLS
jgi:hypothetical protein